MVALRDFRRVTAILGLITIVLLCCSMLLAPQGMQEWQKSQDEKLAQHGELLSAHQAYLVDLKDAKLRDRLTRLEATNDLIAKLLWAILSSVAAVAGYIIGSFRRLRQTMHRMAAKIDALPCMQVAGEAACASAVESLESDAEDPPSTLP